MADLIAFGNEWIPRIKRMKTEDGNRVNDSDHGEDLELSKPKVNSGNEELVDNETITMMTASNFYGSKGTFNCARVCLDGSMNE